MKTSAYFLNELKERVSSTLPSSILPDTIEIVMENFCSIVNNEEFPETLFLSVPKQKTIQSSYNIILNWKKLFTSLASEQAPNLIQPAFIAIKMWNFVWMRSTLNIRNEHCCLLIALWLSREISTNRTTLNHALNFLSNCGISAKIENQNLQDYIEDLSTWNLIEMHQNSIWLREWISVPAEANYVGV